MSSPSKIWRERKYHLTVSNPGKLISYSLIHQAPLGFEKQAPYFVGLIELKNGQRVTSQIIEAKRLKIGQRMKVVLRNLNPQEKKDVIHYGLKFKPW